MSKTKGYVYQQAGFTLIEVVTVVAIVAILSIIVLAFLGTSKTKSNDAIVQSQLKSMIAQAQLYIGATSAVSPTTTFPVGVIGGNVFTDSTPSNNGIYRLIKSLPSGTVVYYGSSSTSPLAGGSWALAASTSTGSYCVDYSGIGRAQNTTVLTQANAPTLYPNIANGLFTCN